MKPGALLLLLAVAASQMDLCYTSSHYAGTGGEVDISSCPITLYGRKNNMLNVTFNADSSVSLCFNNNQSGAAQDCLLLGNIGSANTVHVHTEKNKTEPGSPVHNALPNIKSTSNCYLMFQLLVNGSQLVVEGMLVSFGAQSALQIKFNDNHTLINTTMDITVGNTSMGSWFFTQPQLNGSMFFDVSGCRVSGVPYAAGSNIGMGPIPCSKLICTVSANINMLLTCGPMEVCQDNMCVPLVMCTVTGSNIIDFHGRVQSVKDRCTYSLMTPEKSQDFNLMAGFRERRRKDVSFLDYMIILHPSGVLYLEQGGRVRTSKRALPVNATAQMFYGVEISKDHTGVVARIPSSNMTLFFDGNTAHVAGPAEAVVGLCGNPNNPNMTTPLSARKESLYSAAGCEIQHNDTDDKMIDCQYAKKHCNLTREAPFAACHNYVDPEPYITACTNTLCSYPLVDGLGCQFIEAYTRACSLRGGITLKDWKSVAGCLDDPQAFCRDHYCSDHEFCGGTRCRCRAMFASKYKPRNALGDPTVCMQMFATMTLAKCLLEDKGIDYTYLHLNDPSCKGEMDDKTHMVTFSFDSVNTCGTEVVTNNSQIIYHNTIVTRNRSLDIITRQDQVEIDFSCLYTQPDIRSVSFTIKDSSVVQQIVSGVWNYTLMMNAYTDSRRQMLVGPGTELKLNQKIWLELKTVGLEDSLVVIVTDSCWATSKPSPDDRRRYDLIIKGCPNPADATVYMEANGEGPANIFTFNMFQFSGQTGEIYLHCKIELCPIQTRSCAPSCGGGASRRRRSFESNYVDGNPAIISMAWSN